MFGQIGLGVGAVFGKAVVAEGFDVAVQDVSAQPARAAVDEQLQRVGTEVFRQQIGAVNGINGLQFGKMVAAADGAQGSLKGGVGQDFLDPRLPFAAQGRVDIADLLGEFGGFAFGGGKGGLPKGHTAADVAADQCGIKTADAEKGRADRVAASGVQIGHAGHAAHGGKTGGGFELAHGIAFQPGIGGGN